MADKKLVKLQGEQLLRDHVRLTWASAIFIDDHRAHLLWKRGLLFCSANNLFDNSGNPIKNQQTYHFYICLNLISSLVSRKTFLENTHFTHDYFHLDLVSEYYDTNGSDMKFVLFTVAIHYSRSYDIFHCTLYEVGSLNAHICTFFNYIFSSSTMFNKQVPIRTLFHRGSNTRGENWILWKGQSKESAVFRSFYDDF